MRIPRWLAWSAGLILLLCCAFYATRVTCFEAMGRFLVNTQAPEQADIIVVLGGDWNGNRILKAAELVKNGYAPHVLVSGAGYIYGKYESDLAVAFAVSHGYDEKIFSKFLFPVTSTREEALAVIPELRRRKIKKYILVTTEFHSRRAGNLFRQIGPDLEVKVVSPPDTLDWSNWWTEREGRKTFLLEWTKTVTSAVGM